MSEKKSTGKSAGSTKQWRQLGGGKRPDGEELELQDVQPFKRLDSEEAESQAIQASSSPAIQPSESLDVPPLEHLAIQDVRQIDSQESKRLEVEPSSHSTIQPSKSPDKGESSMPNSTIVEHPSTQKSKQQRDKLTVYLEPELNDWVRQQVIIEKRRRGHHVEISDIINEALQRMREGTI